MVVMVTSFSSRFRPPPDPLPWSLCKSRPSSFQLEPPFIFAETSSLLVKLSKGIVY
ncbi:unnamed protein product, partial [Brassica oleracea]